MAIFVDAKRMACAHPRATACPGAINIRAHITTESPCSLLQSGGQACRNFNNNSCTVTGTSPFYTCNCPADTTAVSNNQLCLCPCLTAPSCSPAVMHMQRAARRLHRRWAGRATSASATSASTARVWDAMRTSTAPTRAWPPHSTCPRAQPARAVRALSPRAPPSPPQCKTARARAPRCRPAASATASRASRASKLDAPAASRPSTRPRSTFRSARRAPCAVGIASLRLDLHSSLTQACTRRSARLDTICCRPIRSTPRRSGAARSHATRGLRYVRRSIRLSLI